MKYIFELSSRTDVNTSVEKKHKKLIGGLKLVKSPWGIGEGIYPAPTFNDAIVAMFSFNKLLGKGINGDAMYRYRSLLTDDSMDDDKIYIEFNPSKIDYNTLLSDVFKKYIDFFEPYVAQIFDEEIIYEDFERTQNKNLRKDFIRFYPVSYYDAKYCREALGVSLLELKTLLIGQVDKVELYKDGIIIIASSDLLSIEEADRIDAKLKSLFQIAL